MEHRCNDHPLPTADRQCAGENSNELGSAIGSRTQARGGTRTRIRPFAKQALFPLSYGGLSGPLVFVHQRAILSRKSNLGQEGCYRRGAMARNDDIREQRPLSVVAWCLLLNLLVIPGAVLLLVFAPLVMGILVAALVGALAVDYYRTSRTARENRRGIVRSRVEAWRKRKQSRPEDLALQNDIAQPSPGTPRARKPAPPRCYNCNRILETPGDIRRGVCRGECWRE